MNNTNLEELILRWNNFSSVGGKEIFLGLSKNESLIVFDISHNNLGKIKKSIYFILRQRYHGMYWRNL